jgi:hypothetical protein
LTRISPVKYCAPDTPDRQSFLPNSANDDEKHESKHGRRRADGKGEIPPMRDSRAEAAARAVSLKSFFRCKDLLPEKRNLSRVPPELAGSILCKPCAKPLKFSAKLVN